MFIQSKICISTENCSVFFQRSTLIQVNVAGGHTILEKLAENSFRNKVGQDNMHRISWSLKVCNS